MCSSDLFAFTIGAQGPHEAPIRAGEERVLTWEPMVNANNYTVQAVLVYDLNRYNDKTFVADQTEIYRTSLLIKAQRKAK